MKAQILEKGTIIHKDGNIILHGWSWSFSEIPKFYKFEKDTVYGWTLQELEEMTGETNEPA